MSWHQTIVVGYLGGDPEMRHTQDGKTVTNFSVAVSETWKDRNTQESMGRTTWYRVSVWNGQAESCNTFLKKGSQVMVIGNVSTRPYMNNNGEAAASLDLNAQSVRFLGKNGSGNSSDYDGPPDVDGDDIPF